MNGPSALKLAKARAAAEKTGRLKWRRPVAGCAITVCGQYSIRPVIERGTDRYIAYELINHDENRVVAGYESLMSSCRRLAQEDFERFLARGGKPRREQGLFTRIIAAERAGTPLLLQPGDVMQLVDFFADHGITRESQFENSSAWGFRARPTRDPNTG